MDTFDKDIYGEIPISDFIAQFRGMSIDGAVRRHVVQASRYFQDPEAVLDKIAAEI